MKSKLLILVAVLLGGCATGYQEKGHSGGYSQTRLDKNVFKVNFKGNGYTSREKADDFAMMRAAELTLESGYQYFSIAESSYDPRKTSMSSPVYATTNVNSYGNNSQSTTVLSGGETYDVSRPEITKLIICYSEKPNNILSFEAKYVLDSLKGKYKK